MKKNLTWAFLAALALTACEKDDMSDNGPVELKLTSGIEVQTKATHELDQAFKSGEKIHVWVDDAKNAQTTVTKENLYENVEMTVGKDGALTSTNPMYFPETGNQVNIYALHTNATLAGNTYPTAALAHTVASDQQSTTDGYAGSDLAYVKKTGVARTSNAVTLQFQHLLSKLEVVLKEGSGETNFLDNISKVEILGTLPNANITLDKTKDISITAGGTAAPIQIDTDVTAKDADESLNEAIIVPQTVAANSNFIQITLTTGGVFTYKLANATTFEGGKKYKYTITANQTALGLTAEITPWGNGGGDDAGTATM